MINEADWDSVHTSDYVCDERNRIGAAQTAAIVDLLEELRREVCGDGIVEGDETCDDGGVCRGEGGEACAGDEDCAGERQCVEGSCVRRCSAGDECESGACVPVGGDGCAANCTREDLRVGRLESCASDVDCRAHERCRRTCNESGFPCDGDEDCATRGIDDFCRSSRCEVLCGELVRCQTSASGDLFDCDLLGAQADGGLHDMGLAFVRSDVDPRRVGDNVSTGVLRFE